jgi:hypothetical protein
LCMLVEEIKKVKSCYVLPATFSVCFWREKIALSQ